MTGHHTYQTLLASIVENPEDDELRLEFARAVRPHDEPWATFIELQVARARRRRTAPNDYLGSKETVAEERLRTAHRQRWAQAMPAGISEFYFYRGFVARVHVDPYWFLEHGERLMQSAPIRHVSFRETKERRFPLGELLDSPLLERLDSVELRSVGLGDEDVASIASSSHLTRCVWLCLSGNRLGLPAFAALAGSPWASRLLYVARELNAGARSAVYFPGERLMPTDETDGWGADIWDWGPLPPEGKALEREHGYLPWLHIKDNACSKYDARWYFDHGVLPIKPAGAPVDHDA